MACGKLEVQFLVQALVVLVQEFYGALRDDPLALPCHHSLDLLR